MADESLAQLPADLKPRKDREPLEIEIPNDAMVANVPPSALPEIAKEFELIGLSRAEIQKLGVLGINLESIGTVQVANGAALVSLQCALHIVQKLKEGTTDFESALKAAGPAGALLRAITTANNSLKTKLPTSAKAAPGPTRKASFPADGRINIQQAVVQVSNKS